MSEKKMGRPTTIPKPYQLTAKYDEECKQILDRYRAQEQVSLMEAVRRGIRKLETELK